MAEAFPEQADWIEKVQGRIVDLLEPFHDFDYYHPDQEGAASIKSVLLVLTERSYADLEIHEGGQARMESLRATLGAAPKAECYRCAAYCVCQNRGFAGLVRWLSL